MRSRADKILGVTASLIFFSMFFLWGFRGQFWTVFTAFFPKFHIIYAATAFAFFLISLFFRSQAKLYFNFLARHRYKFMPLTAFILSSLIAVYVFDSIPHVIDAAHFLWIARTFIETGTFHLPASELYEYYQDTFALEYNGRFFSLFLPGFSVFLAPFVLLGIPQLFSPLCNGIAVLLLGKIADVEFEDDRISFFAMVFATCSSFFLFMSASFMTHTFNLVLVLLSLYLVLTSKNRAGNFIGAGFCSAYLLMIRPQNAFFVYCGMLVVMFLRKMRLKNAVIFTLPFIFVGSLLMLYNNFYTGDPFVFPQDIYFLIREPYPFCHRMGFGKGCPNTEGIYLPDEGLTFTYAFHVAFARLTQMNFNMSGHPLIFVFLVAAFLYSFRKNFELSVFFLIFFVGYFFFYLSGNLFGPRYFLEVIPLLLIPCGYAFFKLMDSKKTKYFKPLIAAVPLTINIFLCTAILPTLLERFSDTFWNTDRAVEEAIEEEHIENSVVFIPPQYSSVFLNLMEKPPFDRHGNLILLDLGEENLYATAYFMEKYGLNDAYVIDYYEKNAIKTAVTPITEAVRDYVYFEFEDKRLPKTGKPDYGVNFAASEEDPKKFYPVKSIDADVSKGNLYAMRFDELTDSSYYDFSHPILEAGEYEFNLFYLSDRCGTEIDVSIDGDFAGSFSSYSERQVRNAFTAYINLDASNHTFRLTPRYGHSCLMIDSAELLLISE